MKTMVIVMAGAAALMGPVAAQAQTNPLSSIFQCNNADNRQGTGAVVGGIIGGIIGNQAAGDDSQTLGTILGVAAGAAVGSYIGCNMTGNDSSQAETATRLALEQNRSQTWTNSRTGSSGRIDIVRSFYRETSAGPQPGGYYGGPVPLNQVRFARGVQFPDGAYDLTNDTYSAPNTVNMRAGPSTRTQVVGQLRAGDRFQALARLGNGWLLVGENGVATGYVAERVVRLEARGGSGGGGYPGAAGTYDQGYEDGYADGYAVARGGRATRRQPQGGYNPGGYYPPSNQPAERQLCRTFDQTTQQRNGYNRQTERFTACQSANGEWLVL